MADFPDWTRLFQLAGTEITIPINIEASDVTIPVSIDAATTIINVNLADSDIMLYVRIYSVEDHIHIGVDIESSVVTIDINFNDQSVAVFDAAKWFAHQAAQVFVLGSDTQDSGVFGTVATRVVPAGTTYFITYVSGGYNGSADAHVGAYLSLPGGITIRLDGTNGINAIFDTPLRMVGAAVVELYMGQWSGASAQMVGGFGGYDEVEE